MTKETGKFPTQAKNATYGYINLPCDSRVRLLGGASIPGLQNLLGMTARPIVSVDWAGPQFRTVDAKAKGLHCLALSRRNFPPWIGGRLRALPS